MNSPPEILEIQNACILLSEAPALGGAGTQAFSSLHYHQPRHAAGDFAVTPTLLPRTHTFQGAPRAPPGGCLPSGKG